MREKGRVQKMLTVLNNLKHFCPISSLFKNSNSSRSVFKARSKAPSSFPETNKTEYYTYACYTYVMLELHYQLYHLIIYVL